MTKHSYGPSQFQRDIKVSRETLDRLILLVETLKHWQDKINLISETTADDIWQRHILDSAQLFNMMQNSIGRSDGQNPAYGSNLTNDAILTDLGSGAGFPGLILAIMGFEKVHLIDSDRRKCIFLREAARVTNTQISVHNRRIEQMEGWQSDIIIARACAPLNDLLAFAEKFIGPDTVCFFLKGQDVERELTQAHKCWNMEVERITSQSSPGGRVLRIWGVSRAA